MKTFIPYGSWLAIVGLLAVYLWCRDEGHGPCAAPASAIRGTQSAVATGPQHPIPMTHAQIPALAGSWAAELRELEKLAATAPDAALARVSALPDKHERKAAAAAVCAIVAEADPARGMTAAWRFDLGRFADETAELLALERLAMRWAEVDSASAVAWAATLPADDEARRDRVVKGIAAAIAPRHPDVAAQLVAGGMWPGTLVQLDAAIDVLRHWAARDHAGALQWASRFPEGPLRERGIDELARLSHEE